MYFWDDGNAIASHAASNTHIKLAIMEQVKGITAALPRGTHHQPPMLLQKLLCFVWGHKSVDWFSVWIVYPTTYASTICKYSGKTHSRVEQIVLHQSNAAPHARQVDLVSGGWMDLAQTAIDKGCIGGQCISHNRLMIITMIMIIFVSGLSHPQSLPEIR
jgi:hypothetical protein